MYKASQAIIVMQLSASQTSMWVQVDDVSLSFVQSYSLGNNNNMNVSDWVFFFVTQPYLIQHAVLAW